MAGFKNSSLFKCYLLIALVGLVFLGLMVSSQAMAGVSRVEETDPSVSFSGSWTVFPTPPASPDPSKASGGTLRYSVDPAALCSFDFDGRSISWIGFKQDNLGISEVSIDGVKVADVDLYAPAPTQWKQVLYSKDDLRPGHHTITIKPTPHKNALSTNYYTNVDAFDVYVCPGTVCVISPKLGDNWSSREAHQIILDINTSKTSQYKLAVRCDPQTWAQVKTKPIAARQCDYYGVCPDYLWSVPPVTGQLACQIGVQLLDANFSQLAVATSDSFSLAPGPLSGFSIVVNALPYPLLQTVPQGGPAGGGAAQYKVSGGTPPYVVSTQVGGVDNFLRTTIDNQNTPRTYINPIDTPTVRNTLCAPCPDRTVTVKAVDDVGATAYAFYQISCALSLKPSSRTVDPGGLAQYEICGGKPPYKVATLIGTPLAINFEHTTIDGHDSVQTYNAAPNNTFQVADDGLSCPVNSYTVGVQDSTGKIATAKYNINCP